MRLTDLEPRWISTHWGSPAVTDGLAFGLSFRCPHCVKQRVAILFQPFIDPGNAQTLMPWAMPGAPNPNTGEVKMPLFWQRTGDTFDTLTLTPSIDFSKYGHWHGHITNGEVVP